MNNINDDTKYVNEMGMTYAARKMYHNRITLPYNDLQILAGHAIERQEGYKNVTNMKARKAFEKKLARAVKALEDLQKDVDFGWGFSDKRY